jgi:hypothetical protein
VSCREIVHERRRRPPGRRRQRGATLIEFAIVGPIVTVLGLAIVQYGMLFFAKNQINYASFMAARAGAMGNAKMAAVRNAYVKALIPLFGGGRNEAELAEAYGRATRDAGANCAPPNKAGKTNRLCVEVLNPTKESFDDFNDSVLESQYGARAIPNGGQLYKSANNIGTNSGQNIQDANLIKLRITHGYEPKVWLMGLIYTKYLQWLDTKTDAYHTQLVDAGLIPVVTNVTLQMQSDPIEDDNASSPGPGNNGDPSDPGDPPVVHTDPPGCATMGCTAPAVPTDPGGGAGGGMPPDSPPPCSGL